MTNQPTLTVYLADRRSVVIPDREVEPGDTLRYEATRGFGFTLAAFDRTSGVPMGFVGVDKLGFETARAWLDASVNTQDADAKLYNQIHEWLRTCPDDWMIGSHGDGRWTFSEGLAKGGGQLFIGTPAEARAWIAARGFSLHTPPPPEST